SDGTVSLLVVGGVDQSAELLADYRAAEVLVAFDAEGPHRQGVVLAEAEGGLVDHHELALEGLFEGQVLETLSGGVDARIGGVDRVDAVLGDPHGLRAALQGPLSGDGVGGGVAEASAVSAGTHQAPQ